MAKNKRKSFSKVTVSSPVLTNLDKIPPKLDILENNLSSEKVIEIPQDLKIENIDANTEEPKFSDEVYKNIKDYEYQLSLGILCLGESINTNELEILTKSEITDELEVLTKSEITDELEVLTKSEITDEFEILTKSEIITELEILTKLEETNKLEIVNHSGEIIVSEIDNNQDKNISNDKKNTIELTEIKILNEETIQSNNKSINCGRKYCCIL
jgi:S-DNA-T family DNA segregation ATPase FtsK/SpoIIIE